MDDWNHPNIVIHFWMLLYNNHPIMDDYRWSIFEHTSRASIDLVRTCTQIISYKVCYSCHYSIHGASCWSWTSLAWLHTLLVVSFTYAVRTRIRERGKCESVLFCVNFLVPRCSGGEWAFDGGGQDPLTQGPQGTQKQVQLSNQLKCWRKTHKPFSPLPTVRNS